MVLKAGRVKNRARQNKKKHDAPLVLLAALSNRKLENNCYLMKDDRNFVIVATTLIAATINYLARNNNEHCCSNF